MITTSKREKQYIRQQALRVGATRLLEVGCFKGQTTQILSHVAGDDGYVVAIDPMKWASKPAHFFEWLDGVLHPFSYEPTFWKNVSRSGYDNVRLIKRLSHDPEVLEDPDPRLKDLDLVFIDGEHLYDTAMTDFRNWGSRVRSGGRILLHDCIDRFPGVQRAVAEIQADPRFSVSWPTPQSGTIATVEVRSA